MVNITVLLLSENNTLVLFFDWSTPSGQLPAPCKHSAQLHRKTHSAVQRCSPRLFASPGRQFNSSFNLTISESRSETRANATWRQHSLLGERSRRERTNTSKLVFRDGTRCPPIVADTLSVLTLIQKNRHYTKRKRARRARHREIGRRLLLPGQVPPTTTSAQWQQYAYIFEHADGNEYVA